MVNAQDPPVAEIEEKRTRSGSFSQPKPKQLRPFNTCEVKILLLENVNETAVSAFKKQGYQVHKRIAWNSCSFSVLLHKSNNITFCLYRSKLMQRLWLVKN